MISGHFSGMRQPAGYYVKGTVQNRIIVMKLILILLKHSVLPMFRQLVVSLLDTDRKTVLRY